MQSESVAELPPTAELYALYDQLRRQYFVVDDQYAIPPSADVTIEWSARLTRSAGICYRPADVIRLSTHYHERYPGEIANTLTHEMIHLVVPGHGPAFRAWLVRIERLGGHVSRYAQERAKAPAPPRWCYRCRTCGLEWNRRRRYAHQARHHRCGRCGGRLHETPLHPA